MTHRSLFRYFKTSPEIIRLAVMLNVRYPLSLGNVEDGSVRVTRLETGR
jgi:putative transposase